MKGLRDTIKAGVFAIGSCKLATRMRLEHLRRRSALIILNLHKVGSKTKSTYQGISADTFEGLVEFCKIHFHITTFKKIGTRTDKPQLILSFDDGYLDYVATVAPILRKHGIRANQNIIPWCAESGLPPLNVAIQDFLGQASEQEIRELAIPGLNCEVTNPDPQRVSRFIKFLTSDERQKIAGILWQQLEASPHFQPSKMMTTSDMREVADCTEFGMHSYQHDSMGVESDHFFKNDLYKCNSWSREALGQTSSIYAFPNGSHRTGQLAMAREAGYQHILLVDEGLNTAQGSNAGVYQRLTFHSESEAESKFRALGRWKTITS